MRRDTDQEPLVSVLIVDDDATKAMSLSAALDGLGLELHHASSGEAGLKELIRRDFSVILLDVKMPGLDGFETAKLIRSRPRYEKTPLLFISSYSPSEVDLDQGYALGAVDYIFAPVVPQILRAKVSAFVDLHRKNQLIRRQAEALERKVREQRQVLLENEERFRLMLDNVQEYAIFMLDVEGRFSTWNPGAQRLLGYTEEEIIGSSGFRIFTPEDIRNGEADKEMDTARRTGQAADERWHVRKDGSRFWASGFLTAMRDEGGSLRGYVKILRDFTDRMLAQEALERSENLFRKLVEDVRDYAIYMIDPQGIVTSWNRGAERIKGYRADEILGKHYSCFFTPEDLRAGKPAIEMKEAEETGRYEDIGWRVRKDGTWFWGDEIISSIRDPEGVLKGFTKVTRDITERKKAEESSARQLHSLQALDDISRVLEANLDLENILQEAMERLLVIFRVERAYLAQPGHPEENLLSLPFMATHPDFPGPTNGTAIPMDDFNRGILNEILKTSDPRMYGPFNPPPDYEAYRESFSIQSLMVIVLRLQAGKPWVLGIQQCTAPKEWTEEEMHLFKEIAHRIAGTLGNLLFHRNLLQSEERFRQLAEGLPQIIWTATPAGKGDYLNRRWYEYSGTPADRSMERSWVDFLHPEEKERLLAKWSKCYEAGDPFQDELRLRNAEGEYRWHLSLAMPIKDAQGKLWKWVGSLTDMESQKSTEMELRRSRAQLSTVLEGITDGIVVQDASANLLFLNQAAATLLGYPSPQAVLEAVNSPRGDKIRGAISVFDEHGAPLPREKTPGRLAMQGIEVPPMILRYRMDDQSQEKWVVNRAKPIFGEDGKVQYIISITQDITQIRKAEAELRQSQKMEAIGRLAGGIAHDFNNLLTAINGYSEVALGMAEPGNPLAPILREILDAGNRAASLTNQLLAHSRKQMLVPKVLDLNETVRGMDKMLRRLIGEDVNLVSLLNPDIHLVKADPGQIEQVILNLALNSRDAMPKGGMITLETSLARVEPGQVGFDEEIPPGDYFVLTVSDTGHGMSREVKERIFEPFYTTKGIGKGTGLGLSTVYGIVKQSGGYLQVYSEPDRGATFKVFLPVVTEANPHHQLLQDGEIARHSSNGETILLVEDEDSVRKLTRSILASLNYRVLEASSGEAALEMAGNSGEKIQLLLTDVVMQGMGGQELAQRLKAQHPGLKTIFMSGYTNDAIVRNGVLEATSDFIQKPFSPKALAQKVGAALFSRQDSPGTR